IVLFEAGRVTVEEAVQGAPDKSWSEFVRSLTGVKVGLAGLGEAGQQQVVFKTVEYLQVLVRGLVAVHLLGTKLQRCRTLTEGQVPFKINLKCRYFLQNVLATP